MALKNPARALSLGVIALSVLALGASPTSRADKTAQKMLKMQDALKKGQQQIDSLISTLNALASAQGKDLVTQYKKFSDQVHTLDSTAKKVRSQADKAASQREEYMKAWQKDQDKIQNEQLKAASEARRSQLKPVIDQIKDATSSGKDHFTPLLQNLKDLDLYLGNNLTDQGLAAAHDLIAQCNQSAAFVKDDVEKANAALEQLAALVTPGGAKK